MTTIVCTLTILAILACLVCIVLCTVTAASIRERKRIEARKHSEQALRAFLAKQAETWEADT